MRLLTYFIFLFHLANFYFLKPETQANYLNIIEVLLSRPTMFCKILKVPKEIFLWVFRFHVEYFPEAKYVIVRKIFHQSQLFTLCMHLGSLSRRNYIWWKIMILAEFECLSNSALLFFCVTVYYTGKPSNSNTNKQGSRKPK